MYKQRQMYHSLNIVVQAKKLNEMQIQFFPTRQAAGLLRGVLTKVRTVYLQKIHEKRSMPVKVSEMAVLFLKH